MSDVHVLANHRCGPDERFIGAHDYDDVIPNWRRVPAGEATESNVIKCRFCKKPARLMDCHWPYMSGACRCEDHDDFKAFPLED